MVTAKYEGSGAQARTITCNCKAAWAGTPHTISGGRPTMMPQQYEQDIGHMPCVGSTSPLHSPIS
eukprot:74627-Chlamydomonas_euryale.AAC.2